MSFNTHAVCDWCESKLLAGDEDELLEEGWLTLAYGPEYEDKMDFCTLDCVRKWVESPSAVEMLEKVASREDD